MNYALLDYDGYIAKAYYAGADPENPIEFEECYTCLYNMEQYAIEKAQLFFMGEEFKVIKVLSGHTFKKDLFPSYKRSRQRDDFLGIFRDEIKKRDDVTIVENMEADDLLVYINENHRENSVVFSDDKDLHKYCKWTCKLNEEYEINKDNFSKEAQLIQMISGDSVDNIKGVPMFGEQKAKKYLDSVGYSLQNVIKLYKDKQIDADECLKNLILVHPLAKGLLDVELKSPKEISNIYYNIEQVIRFLSDKVKEVYFEENTIKEE